MDQPTFADLEYQGKKRKTHRELFLERMDGLIPWQKLEDRIRPFYPKAGRGRRPYPLSVMLRVHCVQLFYNLSDPGGGTLPKASRWQPADLGDQDRKRRLSRRISANKLQLVPSARPDFGHNNAED